MTASNGGAKKGGKSFKALVDNLRAACPPNKVNELEGLVKEMKGDEEKIDEKISEWWESANVTEEQWEDVAKKHAKKKETTPPIASSRGRGGRGGGGEGGRGRSSARGSGRGAEGRGRGRSSGGRGRGRSQHREKLPSTPATNGNDALDPLEMDAPLPAGLPTNVRVPHGAWAKQQTPEVVPDETHGDSTLPISIMDMHDVLIAPQTVTPLVSNIAPKPVARPTGPAGNVWATKGSAHLIQAEKPKPPAPAAPAPIKRMSPAVPQPAAPLVQNLLVESEVEPEPEPEVGLAPTVLSTPDEPPEEEDEPVVVVVSASPKLAGMNVWGSAPPAAPLAPQPEPEVPEPELPVPPSPVLPSISAPVVEPPAPTAPPVIPVPPPQPSAPPVVPSVQPKIRAPPPSVLNMGRWEASADDENIDFGFGAYGVDVEAPVVLEAPSAGTGANNVSQPTPKEAPAATAPSPARPPPGLSIGGTMRPIPPDAVLVHELENKLEEASLNAAAQQSVPEPTAQVGLPSQQAPEPVPVHADPVTVATAAEHIMHTHHTHAYSQPTSSMGMYSYGAGGFIGGMPGPSLGNPLPPKLPMGGPLSHSQQQTLYGVAPSSQQPHASSPSSGNAPNNTNVPTANDNNHNPAPGLPPGMPGMPYSPALFYGQQPHMGQYQGQLGYNYGYGAQFGGVQGAFGYPPSMGQHGGYGNGPHYDDQGGSHQGSGGYQKNTGGYRGRGNHHNSGNQYQNQYNPQQHAGAYGAQPYGGMGYHGDFGRGAYGQPAGIQDHYIQQQQQQQQQAQIGGFQTEGDQYGKSKKGGGPRGGYQQFGGPPPGPPPHLNQQPFGLQGSQGGGTSESSTGPSTGAGGGGGWSNQSTGGWGGGAPSWQGK